MANTHHLSRLKKSMESWNQWREKQPEVEPDLSGANLRGANLSDADFKGANLRGANLSNADLSFANLSSANLRSADLSIANLSSANLSDADLSNANLSDADFKGADLSGTHLSGANLSGANLSFANLSDADLSNANLSDADFKGADFKGADLSGTHLSGANLSGANLSYADLSGATIGWTSFGDRDLRGIIGLDTVQHTRPSPLSINTLYQSKGEIPEVFVRGTGAPDVFLEYMHALVGKPFDYYSCFISYSSKDQAFADRLYNDLQGSGVRCWYARKDLKPGDFYRNRIDESIKVYDKVVLILSEHAVQSEWVEKEVERAWEREGEPAEPGEPLVLFPIRLDDAVMQTERRWAATLRYLRHIGDFTGWKDHDAYHAHFQHLLHDLKQERPQRRP